MGSEEPLEPILMLPLELISGEAPVFNPKISFKVFYEKNQLFSINV